MHKIQIPKIIRVVPLIIPATACLANSIVSSHRFTNATRPFGTKLVCQQTDNNFEALLAEASQNRYVVRRVEFAGNENSRDYKLRRRVIKEEAIFTRAAFAKSLNNLKKLNFLKSVRVGNVALDRENKFIDILFEVEENEKARKR